VKKTTPRSNAEPQPKRKQTEPPVIPTKPGDSVRLEKIENGFLANHATDGPDGYHTKTVYHPQPPVITIDTPKPNKTK